MRGDLKPRIFVNAALHAAGLALNALLGLLIARALAHHLGREGYGLYALAFVYFSFAGILAGLGFDAILVRELARNPGERDAHLTAGLSLKFLFGTLALALAALYFFLRPYPGEFRWAVLLLMAAHLLGTLDTFECLLRAELRAGPLVGASLAAQLLHLLLVLAAVARGWGLVPLMALYLAARLARGILLFRLGRGAPPFRWRWEGRAAARLLRDGAALGLGSALWVVYFRLDTVMLEHMRGIGEVALYAAAYKFVDLSLVASGAFASSLYPLIAARYPENMPGFRWVYQQAVDYTAAAGAAAGALLLILAPQLISLVFGPPFAASVPILRLLSLAVFLIFVGQVLGGVLVALGMQGAPLLVARSLAVLLNLSLNFLWIPLWGGAGAALATVATEGFLVLAVPCLVARRAGMVPRPLSFLLSLLAMGVAYGVARGAGVAAGALAFVLLMMPFLFSHRRQFLDLLRPLAAAPRGGGPLEGGNVAPL